MVVMRVLKRIVRLGFVLVLPGLGECLCGLTKGGLGSGLTGLGGVVALVV